MVMAISVMNANRGNIYFGRKETFTADYLQKENENWKEDIQKGMERNQEPGRGTYCEVRGVKDDPAGKFRPVRVIMAENMSIN